MVKLSAVASDRFSFPRAELRRRTARGALVNGAFLIVVESVTVAQAQAWGESAIWIDARPDAEFERDHVPGAILLNEDRWNELLPQFLQNWSPEKRIVVYCSSQSCNASREVAKRLRDQAQLKSVFVLQGGWE